MTERTLKELEGSVLRVKKRILTMANVSGQRTHLGGALSMAELLTVLYKSVLRYDAACPCSPERDRFILSKGHCVLAYYAVLAECGFLGTGELDTFQQDGTRLGAHPTMAPDLGIESSNGSLGQGLGMAVGMAKAAKLLHKDFRVYVLCGNGECNEGAVWEAAMLAAQWELDNLTVVIDNNGMQSDGASAPIIRMESWRDKWSSFGFTAIEVDGHNIEEIDAAYRAPARGRPKAVIGNTVKGHGVSFMEGSNDWHHNRLTDQLYEQACRELGVEA